MGVIEFDARRPCPVRSNGIMKAEHGVAGGMNIAKLRHAYMKWKNMAQIKARNDR